MEPTLVESLHMIHEETGLELDLTICLLLPPVHHRFYRQFMKRIFILLTAATLLFAPAARSQDAATEERINQLNGKIEDLIAGLEAQKKVISELRKEIEGLRDQQS